MVLGQACRDSPPDAKGCHSWSFVPQNKTCFLLRNRCDEKDKKNEKGVVSGKRKCAPRANFFNIDVTYSSATGVVTWEKNEYCPPQNYTVQRDQPVHIPYYDYCGSYNISAEVSFGLKCSVNFSLYPIPNWLIAGDGKGCTISRKY